MRWLVISEGRLFALKPSDWMVLLGGTMLCGLFTLLSTLQFTNAAAARPKQTNKQTKQKGLIATV